MQLSDRVTFGDTLGYVQQMFMATASQKPEEFQEGRNSLPGKYREYSKS